MFIPCVYVTMDFTTKTIYILIIPIKFYYNYYYEWQEMHLIKTDKLSKTTRFNDSSIYCVTSEWPWRDASRTYAYKHKIPNKKYEKSCFKIIWNYTTCVQVLKSHNYVYYQMQTNESLVAIVQEQSASPPVMESSLSEIRGMNSGGGYTLRSEPAGAATGPKSLWSQVSSSLVIKVLQAFLETVVNLDNFWWPDLFKNDFCTHIWRLIH